MSFLLNSINKTNEIFSKAGSFNSDIGMFSGFTPIDILSTNLERLENLDCKIMNGGMFNYPYTEIGLSAVGKTTLWIQVISACIDNWYKYYGPVSEAVFYNVEMHTSAERWKMVTGWDDTMMRERVRFVTKSWSIVQIYNDIAILARQKLAHRKELEIDTGIHSIDGGTVKILPTTYVLIDSIASVRTVTELEFGKDGQLKNSDTIAGTSNMDAMQIAKDNTMFINEVKKICEEAKICLVMINHCVEVPILDRYNPPKPQLPGMKFNQKVKGGNELLYQSFCVGELSIRERLFDEKSKIYGNAVHGIVAFMKWLKNKNGPEGVRYPMVFDSATGYRPELTDFEILYTEGQYGIEGSPMSYKLSILPEISFTRKTLLQKCYENPLLARALCFTTRLLLLSNIVVKTTPPDIKELGSIPFDDRVHIIMQYSIDYPGYVNRGYVVDDETIAYNRVISLALKRQDMPNLYMDPMDFDFFVATNGEYTDTHKRFTPGNKKIKIAGEEYVLSDDDDW